LIDTTKKHKKLKNSVEHFTKGVLFVKTAEANEYLAPSYFCAELLKTCIL